MLDRESRRNAVVVAKCGISYSGAWGGRMATFSRRLFLAYCLPTIHSKPPPNNAARRNFTLRNVKSPIVFTEYYEHSLPPQNASATPHFYNLTVDTLTATGSISTGFFFEGLPESVIEGVHMRNINIVGAKTVVGNCSYAVGDCSGTMLPLCPPCLVPQ